MLVGSMKYRMITMDESSTLLLESIALADLLGTVELGQLHISMTC